MRNVQVHSNVTEKSLRAEFRKLGKLAPETFWNSSDGSEVFHEENEWLDLICQLNTFIIQIISSAFDRKFKWGNEKYSTTKNNKKQLHKSNISWSKQTKHSDSNTNQE